MRFIKLAICLFAIIFGTSYSYACPSARKVKPCSCSSATDAMGRGNSRWVNITCSYARSWNQIRDALQPFRRSSRFLIQSLLIEKVRDSTINNGRRPHRLLRHVRVAEVIIADSILTSSGRIQGNVFVDASWITSLHLQELGLKEVPTKALRLLQILNALSLGRNFISSINRHAFRFQSSCLKYLDLQRNQLADVPSQSFHHLPALEVLLLNGNRIRQLSADSFDATPSLEALELSDNELTSIHEHAFAKLIRLKHLGVAGNPLFSTTYKAFQHVPCPHGLLSLDLSATAIDLRQRQWPESTYRNLTSLVLQDHLNTITFDHLSSYSGLIDLDLKGNHQIDTDQFESPKVLPSIQRLDATESSFSINNLRVFPSLETVYLNSNRVRRLKQIHMTPMRSLSILHLSDCNLRHVEMSSFWHLAWSIREINLSHNRLRRLQRRSFHNLRVLAILDLSYNLFRDYGNSNELSGKQRPTFPLDTRFFDRHSSQSLRSLSLAGNGLRRVPQKCLQTLRKLNTLDVSGNRIENIQMQLQYNIELEHLNLKSNKISYIHPHAFRFLAKLRTLNLSWNQLTTINSIIFPTNLRELDVARCYLKELKSPFLGSLNRLKAVDFSYNMIQTISPRLFQNSAGTLLHVDIAMNALNCNCQLQPFVEWLSENKVELSPDSRCFWPIELRYMRPLVASACWKSCFTNQFDNNSDSSFLNICLS